MNNRRGVSLFLAACGLVRPAKGCTVPFFQTVVVDLLQAYVDPGISCEVATPTPDPPGPSPTNPGAPTAPPTEEKCSRFCASVRARKPNSEYTVDGPESDLVVVPDIADTFGNFAASLFAPIRYGADTFSSQCNSNNEQTGFYGLAGISNTAEVTVDLSSDTPNNPILLLAFDGDNPPTLTFETSDICVVEGGTKADNSGTVQLDRTGRDVEFNTNAINLVANDERITFPEGFDPNILSDLDATGAVIAIRGEGVSEIKFSSDGLIAFGMAYD